MDPDTAHRDTAPRLVIRYKEDQARTGIFITGATLPIWAGWDLYVSSWLVKAIFEGVYATGSILGYLDLVFLLCFYFGLALCGAFTVLVCLDNKMTLTGDGLELPRRFLLDLGFHRHRDWKNLKAIEFKNDELSIRFKFGAVQFKTAGLRTSDLKDFVVAVRSNAPDAQCYFDKNAVSLGIPGVRTNPDDQSFTAIWEQDLASRFGSTAFVPLETRRQLQDGRLTVIGQIAFGGLSAIYL
ncbi:MAG TPA: hypothetical protein V6C72_08010, partial [Chroococcales cyanobacterium]